MSLRIDSSPFNVKPGDAGLFLFPLFHEIRGEIIRRAVLGYKR